MANKFENRIKEAFEKRTITPSGNGWDALENQLGEEEVVRRGGYMWYGVAAGFIGIILLSVFFLKQSEIPVTESMEVVTVPVEKKEQGVESKDLLVPVEVIVVSETAEEEKIESVGDSKIPPVEKKPNTIVAVIVTEASEDKVQNSLVTASNLKEMSIEHKIEEVVAMVSIMEASNGLVSDATVDSILQQAQKELVPKQILVGSKNIDANALLAEVEDELNRSLRGQLFEKLKDSYLKVKNAVAYRND